MFPMIVFQFVYDFVDYKGRNVIVKKKKNIKLKVPNKGKYMYIILIFIHI